MYFCFSCVFQACRSDEEMTWLIVLTCFMLLSVSLLLIAAVPAETFAEFVDKVCDEEERINTTISSLGNRDREIMSLLYRDFRKNFYSRMWINTTNKHLARLWVLHFKFRLCDASFYIRLFLTENWTTTCWKSLTLPFTSPSWALYWSLWYKRASGVTVCSRCIFSARIWGITCSES